MNNKLIIAVGATLGAIAMMIVGGFYLKPCEIRGLGQCVPTWMAFIFWPLVILAFIMMFTNETNKKTKPKM